LWWFEDCPCRPSSEDLPPSPIKLTCSTAKQVSIAHDFFIIAGDLYDGDWRDYQTGLFFVGQMGRLAKASIPVFLLFGNHDAESQITKRLTLPGNVHVFSSKKPQTFELERGSARPELLAA